MKRLAVLVFVCVAFLALSGCSNSPMGTVAGYVTGSQGGPAVVGATVSCQTYSTKTDTNGHFELKIEADKPSDIMIAKRGQASTRVQQVSVGKGQCLELAVFNRAAFNPVWSVNPPTISVSLVTGTAPDEVVTAIVPGQQVSGTIKLRIATESERIVNKIYAYLGGDQRTPRAASVFDVPSADVAVNTALYPNGPTTIRVLVYDDNENATLHLVPVVVGNNLPGQVPALGITSISCGVTVGYYAKQRVDMYEKGLLKGDPYQVRLPSGRTVDLRVAPADSTVFVTLSWAPVAGASGYCVYRSTGGQDYVLIGRVLTTSLSDFSACLTPGAKATYKVTAYNIAGEGPGIVRPVTPLAPFNVLLRAPANEATNVSLTPTFSWEKSIRGQFAPNVEIYTTIELYDATSAQIWGQDLTEYNKTDPMSIAYPYTLEPMHVYSWDISSCAAYMLFEDVDDGYSEAVSYAGEFNGSGSSGSTNGTFVFTTAAQ